MIWIGYTTLYREGGAKFERAARTLEKTKTAQFPGRPVRCERIESKRDFVDAMARVAAEGRVLSELHFIGHSGMYGPMFRSTSMPEQFSPHEWRNLSLPLDGSSEAYFHACRTARWFAPFFARTFGVPAHGYHWYTTVSTSPDRFRWEGPGASPDAPLYIVSCRGRKSHGLVGSALKYGGFARVEQMTRFVPHAPESDGTYDEVAELYDDVFADIAVRERECAWLDRHLPDGPVRVLDIGCGNGALLARLSPRITRGTGVDRSEGMIARARARSAGHGNLDFAAIPEPKLPFDDASFDVVISLLSFRYLDWDPIMNEIRRVLAPGGRILIVDMVTAPLKSREYPAFVRSNVERLWQHFRHPEFRRSLRRLVTDPRWKMMLRYNPIRAEHEYKWYLESRFPGRKVELLDVGLDARILAFDSGPLERGWVPPQSYP
jgi:SAM-dependent methyltransferase